MELSKPIIEKTRAQLFTSKKAHATHVAAWLNCVDGRRKMRLWLNRGDWIEFECKPGRSNVWNTTRKGRSQSPTKSPSANSRLVQ